MSALETVNDELAKPVSYEWSELFKARLGDPSHECYKELLAWRGNPSSPTILFSPILRLLEHIRLSFSGIRGWSRTPQGQPFRSAISALERGDLEYALYNLDKINWLLNDSGTSPDLLPEQPQRELVFIDGVARELLELLELGSRSELPMLAESLLDYISVGYFSFTRSQQLQLIDARAFCDALWSEYAPEENLELYLASIELLGKRLDEPNYEWFVRKLRAEQVSIEVERLWRTHASN